MIALWLRGVRLFHLVFRSLLIRLFLTSKAEMAVSVVRVLLVLRGLIPTFLFIVMIMFLRMVMVLMRMFRMEV